MARIFLEITDVRVEQVKDMTNEDCLDEGVEYAQQIAHRDWTKVLEPSSWIAYTPLEAFQHLWTKINKKRGFGWETNPWVWVIEFKRMDNGTA